MSTTRQERRQFRQLVRDWRRGEAAAKLEHKKDNEGRAVVNAYDFERSLPRTEDGQERHATRRTYHVMISCYGPVKWGTYRSLRGYTHRRAAQDAADKINEGDPEGIDFETLWRYDQAFAGDHIGWCRMPNYTGEQLPEDHPYHRNQRPW